MLIYVAGPYRGDVAANIQAAKDVAAECYKAGHDVICPHMNSAHMEQETGLPDEFWLKTTLNLLRRCDAVVLVPGWEKSQGTLAEIEYAKSASIPVYDAVPPLHVTEKERPKQVVAFMEVLMLMYRIHLAKNADYSPANILGTGENGVVVRLWDKIARLLNLSGHKIEISGHRFEPPSTPNCESIEDTYFDAANYSVIGLLVRRGLWGK
jgi:nucleoside 2-deoxyribosyltransferase